MRYLVWGGTGFIGQNLVEDLLKEGHQVAIVTRQDEYKNSVLERVFNIDNQQAIVEYLKKCDGAVFLSAKRLTKDFNQNDVIYNLKIFSDSLNQLHSAGIKNAVFMSTIGVYGITKSPWKEDLENENPHNLYSLSKHTMDQMIQMYNQSNGAYLKSLRLAQVIGKGEREGYLLNSFLSKAEQGKPVTVYGKGIGRRQYIYIKDVIRYVKIALKATGIHGVFNIGIPGSVSIFELAEYMHEVFGVEGAIIKQSYDREDLNCYEMNVEKAHKVFGFSPEYSVKDALIDIRNNNLEKMDEKI